MYLLVLYVNVHHELTPVHVYQVEVLDDTGQYSLDEILAKIATGMDFDIDALILIYEAYSNVGEGHSAKLRDAIRLRLMEKGLFGLVTDIALDENESVVIDTDSENESDVIEIDSDACV